MGKSRRPELHLVRDTASGLPAVVESPRNRPPFPVQAMAVEEDTALVLSADARVRDPDAHPIRIMTDLYADSPHPVGTVVTRGSQPYRCLVIVHDFDAEPSFREVWLQDGLRALLEECQTLAVAALALEPIGVIHGGLSMRRFRELFTTILESARPRVPERIWLVVP